MSDVATAPAPAASPLPAPQKRAGASPLKSPQLKDAEYARHIWCATADAGVTFEDIIRPEYWMHNLDRLRPSDHIEVYFSDGTGYAELLVLTANRSGAKVAFLNKVDLREAAPISSMSDELADYDVKWGGPHHKFRVIKKGVSEPIKTGFATETEAKTWLVAEYLTGADKTGTKVAA